MCVCECVLQVWHHYFGLTKGAIWDNLKSTKWSDFSIFCFHRFSLGTWGLLLLFSCLVESDSCDPMCWGPPGSSVQGISLARILQWLPFPSPWDFPNPGIWLTSPIWQEDVLTLSHLGSPGHEARTFPKLHLTLLSDFWNQANFRIIPW